MEQVLGIILTIEVLFLLNPKDTPQLAEGVLFRLGDGQLAILCRLIRIY